MSKSPKQLPNCLKVVPYTSGKIWSARLILLFLWQCLNISTVINIKILTNSNQQTQSYKFTSHIAAFLSVVLITEMLEICIQTSYDENVQLIFKEWSPCSVWYHLKDRKRRRPHRLVSSVKSLLILLLFLTIAQHESLMYQEHILFSDRILYNSTAQIEPVQEK
jgi:alpha-L-arabinofuranosidase